MKVNYVKTSLIDVTQEIKSAKLIFVITSFGVATKITKKAACNLLITLKNRGVTHIGVCITPAREDTNVIIMDAII